MKGPEELFGKGGGGSIFMASQWKKAFSSATPSPTEAILALGLLDLKSHLLWLLNNTKM